VKSRILTICAWCLVAAAVVVLGMALILESGIRKALEAALPAGVLLALAGHLFTQAKASTEAAEKRSLFNLEGFRQAFDQASSLLSDENNDRAKWIEAARSIAHGEELAKAVTVSEHMRVLELERLKYRGIFHHFLADRSAEFFYGASPPYPSIDDAARASSKPNERHGKSVISTVRKLDESSIRMVWLAASWSKDYKDPLGSRFSDAELAQTRLLLPEVHRYVEHTRNWASVGGELHATGK